MKKREHVQFIISLNCCSWFSADFNLSRTWINKKQTKSDEKITTVYERQYIVHKNQQYIICKIESQIAVSHSHRTKYPCSPSKFFFVRLHVIHSILKSFFCTIYWFLYGGKKWSINPNGKIWMCTSFANIFVVYLIHPFEFKVFKQSSLTCHYTFLLHYEHWRYEEGHNGQFDEPFTWNTFGK
jgi:hypothetical protein